uniref:Pre-mRNA-splicing factor Syf1-like N-terminal HAT-repeats domain-containing protein n=1 Tax=Panthera tigris altaica TaxID=74533 RepID=A0A8C9KFN3_PANTA
FPVPWLPQEEEDLPYEEEIMRNQFSVKCWLRYIEFKQGAPKPRLNQLYERALKLLPCRWEQSQPPSGL